MSKRKLTQNQQRRIQSNNAKTLHRHQLGTNQILVGKMICLVISRWNGCDEYAVHADVENEQGEIVRCNLRRTLKSVVVGDRVVWRKGKTQLQGVRRGH